MPATRLSTRSSCWTCRLRHKKCDQKLPDCGNCTALGIQCYSGAAKPPWMDKGEGQRSMTRRLKAQVKQAARRRRGAAVIERITRDLSDSPVKIPTSDDEQCRPSHSLISPGLNTSSPSKQLKRTESRPTTSTNPKSTIQDRPASYFERAPNDATAPSELELGLIVAYMDYIFPILFPHYRPHIINGGRSWLLTLSMTNKTFLKALVSLSSMFLSTIPSEISPSHQACASKTWEELRKQANMALAVMQDDLKETMVRGVQKCLLESVHLLASIMQLLALELTMTPPEKWQIHLDAAIGLFEQIMHYHGGDKSAPAIYVVLAKISGLRRAGPDIPCADEGAFRFFSSMLIFSDVIATTSLGTSPRLRTYYLDLGRGEPSKRMAVGLEEVMGCQDWLILILGDIVSLKEWKEDQLKTGDLLRSDLLHRGILLDERLQDGLETRVCNAAAKKNSEPIRPLEMLFKHSISYCPFEAIPEKHLNLTRIWAFAARTYLYAVINDGQLDDPNIRDSVDQALCLLLEIQSPIWIRSLIWPICIVGCYAVERQRPILRTIVGRMGALGSFGTGRLMFDILEDAWRRRDDGFEFPDPSDCLKSLGSPVLLM